MARKRMIDPNIWESEDFSALSMLGKVLFIGLFSLADDEGRGKANPVYIRSKLFPYTAEEVRITDIKTALSEIAHRMSVTFYAVDGAQYYALTHWTQWQKIDRPSQSTIPSPEDGKPLDEDSTKDRRTLDEDSSLIEKNRTEENKNRKEKKTINPLTPLDSAIEEFREYRKSMKAPLTDLAEQKLKNELQRLAGDDDDKKIRILDQSIRNGWKGVFELKDGFKRGQSYEQHPANDSDLSHLLVNLDD